MESVRGIHHLSICKSYAPFLLAVVASSTVSLYEATRLDNFQKRTSNSGLVISTTVKFVRALTGRKSCKSIPKAFITNWVVLIADSNTCMVKMRTHQLNLQCLHWTNILPFSLLSYRYQTRTIKVTLLKQYNYNWTVRFVYSTVVKQYVVLEPSEVLL